MTRRYYQNRSNQYILKNKLIRMFSSSLQVFRSYPEMLTASSLIFVYFYIKPNFKNNKQTPLAAIFYSESKHFPQTPQQTKKAPFLAKFSKQ